MGLGGQIIHLSGREFTTGTISVRSRTEHTPSSSSGLQSSQLDTLRSLNALNRFATGLTRPWRLQAYKCQRVVLLTTAEQVCTLSEAEQRARNLKASLEKRGIHPKVLAFCRAELVSDNYFHAVLESVKSIFDSLRRLTGLHLDGAQLVDLALNGSAPMIKINGLQTPSERSEQSGFANLLKSTYGMFRNPTAHEARINWDMSEEDAADLLSLASLIHRRLEAAER